MTGLLAFVGWLELTLIAFCCLFHAFTGRWPWKENR